jgi:AcrR family transcriptional regulator
VNGTSTKQPDPKQAEAKHKPLPAKDTGAGRYRRLPTGAHSLDPEDVRRDQRERLQSALVELTAERGFPAVRILDLTKLARVSRPTFYSLYKDKEDLFLAAFDEIAERSIRVVRNAYQGGGSSVQRLRAAMLAFAELAAAEPDAVSLLVLGGFGAGAQALERRNKTLGKLEQGVIAVRAATAGSSARASAPRAKKGPMQNDLTVRMILGGIREVTAARLRQHRAAELPDLMGDLAAWAAAYPLQLPAGLQPPRPARASRAAANTNGAEPARRASERARQAEGRLPSGRHDLPRHFIVKNQRERIVDATAEIVAEKGLAALTIPDIAKRANVSHQTFYEMYPTKQDAFLGAQKVGLHQALGIAVEAYETYTDDWPRGVAAGLRALLGYLASEPSHAHLTVVDTFAASPLATEIRDTGLHAFASYLQPGFHFPVGRSAPEIAPEAIAGGIWQVLHHYVEHDMLEQLPCAAPQLTFFTLAPFLGAKQAALIARQADKAAAKK